MKKTITLSIPSQSKVEVKSGERISKGTLLYSHFTLKAGTQEIPVSHLLRIKAEHILKYLTKSMGQSIIDGEIIAVKKSFFTKDFVRSPLRGTIESVDLKKGTVSVKSDQSAIGELRIPTTAVVKEITDTSILLEIEGQVFTGEKGKGEESVGPLCLIEGKHVSALDIRGDVEGAIVLGQHFDEDALIKCEVLQAAGCVSLSALSGQRLAWISLSETDFAKLAQNSGSVAWLIPYMSTVIVI